MKGKVKKLMGFVGVGTIFCWIPKILLAGGMAVMVTEGCSIWEIVALIVAVMAMGIFFFTSWYLNRKKHIQTP